MKALLLLLPLLFTISAFGQNLPDSNKYPVDDNVAYKGGNIELWQYLKKNLKYPEQAIKDDIRGIVYVYFAIDTNGYTTDIKVIKGVRDDLNKEAIRCVSLLRHWIPETINGKKVILHHTLSIKFDVI